ncbi:MAG TPA: class I SAM-dependent methyltransferase [Acidimicrobiales bacterium]|jgi:SAM-dependent methyltransferase
MACSVALSDAVLGPVDAAGLAAQRERLLAGARGRVLEVGAGTDRNLAHYPAGSAVAQVVACERTPARRRAGAAPVPVARVGASAAALPFADASFDTVVCTLLMCGEPEPAAAVREMRRVLHPEGSVLFLEPTVGRSPVTARVQRWVSPAWARVAGGGRLDRDTVAILRAGGFVVADCERLSPLGRVGAGTVVRGRAIPRRGT